MREAGRWLRSEPKFKGLIAAQLLDPLALGPGILPVAGPAGTSATNCWPISSASAAGDSARIRLVSAGSLAVMG